MIDTSQLKWMLRGFCSTAQANPEIFYEEGNEETAKAFCHRCPVINICREWAIDNDEEGVWGGMSTADRRAVRRGGKRASCPACGQTLLKTAKELQICLSCGSSWN